MKQLFEYAVTLKDGSTFPFCLSQERKEIVDPEDLRWLELGETHIYLKENDKDELLSPFYSKPFTFGEIVKVAVKEHKQTGRFLLFGGTNFYPQGGMRDFLYQGNDLEELKRYATEGGIYSQYFLWMESKLDWANVLDLETKEIIEFDL